MNPSLALFAARVVLPQEPADPGGLTTGALSYSPAAGTVLRAGTGRTLKVTAATAADYKVASMTVIVNVL